MTGFRLGTRGSILALTQSRGVARALEVASGEPVEVETIRTRGDEVQDRPLPEIGGKGLFTAELDRALLDGEIHLAVHSLKDLPTEMDPALAVSCVPEREDPRDVLVGPEGAGVTLEGLEEGAVLGTSSLRRRALALAFRPDLEVRSVRGNLDTRLRKVDEGGYDALVLAAAGLRRLGREDRIDEWMERTAWLPAPAQGALGIVTRRDDRRTREALSALHDVTTARAVQAERALLNELEGGCQLPIAALALPFDSGLRLWGLVASPDGRRLVRGDMTGRLAGADALGRKLAALLLERGADDILGDVRAGSIPAPAAP